MCFLVERNPETGEEKTVPVYINELMSVEIKNNFLVINGVVEIPKEKLLEIKYEKFNKEDYE